jgi:hypothetical protein
MMVKRGELLDSALRYAELGYPVFPCAPGTKNPITKNGFKNATTDVGQIERWWTRRPTANIGLATEGLLVVDIDASTIEWPGDPERSADLASAGAIAITPRGGRHYVFRRPANREWKCSQSRLAEHVDIRTDGGYIVVAPSLTAVGGYAWAPGLELEERPAQLPEPPSWLIEQLDAFATGSPTLAHATAGPPGANPIPTGQRNATLARLGGAMRRVGMSQAEIVAALAQTNRDRCIPPLAEKEVDRIATSVASYSPDAVSVALAENHYDQMFGDNREVEADDHDPGPMPDALLHVPGLVNDVMQYTLASAPYPEPVLAFAGALALQAFLAGRKVRDAMDNRTNLYVLSLANSGVGKDHARKVNARILVAAGLADGLGTSFASGEGIEDRLLVQPATLFQVDEIDGLLLRVSQARDARHEHIVSMLLQMYSSAASVYVMRAKAGHERAVIDQPCLCLFGTAVPKHFYEALSTRLMTNGFLARLLVLECGKRGAGRDDTSLTIPSVVIESAHWWAGFRAGGNLDEEHPTPRMVAHDADASAVFRDLRLQADTEYDQAQTANDPAGMAIWARAYEKARRLALIYACSACREDPMIDRAGAEWAGAFVLHQTRRMLFMARRYACESNFDAKRKRLIEVLEQWRAEHGDDWMPFWKVNRRLPWSSREHDEVRDTLLQQRLIEHQVMSTRGRPAAMYRMTVAGLAEEVSS